MKKKISYLILFLGLFVFSNMNSAKALISETDSRCGGFYVQYQTLDGNAASAKFIKLNDYYTQLDTPTKVGYKFAGWYYDQNLTQRVYDTRALYLSNNYKVKSNNTCPVVTLYAKWEFNQDTRYQNCNNGFRLIYHYNNPLQTDEDLFVSNNGIFGLNIPTRDGYTFGGWYYDTYFTQPVYAKKEVDLDSRYKIQNYNGCSVIHIYAKWNSNTKTEESCGGFYVKYNTMNGDQLNQTFVRSYDYYATLATPTRVGYNFAGWYYDASLTQRVNDNRAVYLSDNYKVKSMYECPSVTLYAKWEAVTKTEEYCGGFNVNYNPMNGNQVKQVFIKTNDSYTTFEVPTRSGYNFVGWYYDANYNTKVNVTKVSQLSNSYKVPTNNCPTVTLYARWEKASETSYYTEEYCGGFNIKYDSKNGNQIKKVFIKSNDNVTYLDTPTKNGYKFAGWYYDDSYKTKVDVSKASQLLDLYKFPSNSDCPTVHLFAKWEKVSETSYYTEEYCGGFNIKYDPKNGNQIKKVFIKSNDNVTYLDTPTKNGYKFAGWYYDDSYKTKVDVSKASQLLDLYKFPSNSDCPTVHLFAKWEEEQKTEEYCGGFNVRYQTLDGSAVKEVFIKTNDYYTSLETPTRSGYKFLGWYYDINFTKPVNDSKAGNLLDAYKTKSSVGCPVVNIYAKWEKIAETMYQTEESCGGFRVRYQTLDGTNVKEGFVKTNDYNSTLEIPTRNGYKFLGWYYDINLTKKVDVTIVSALSSDYKVKSSTSCPLINIYAKWEPEQQEVHQNPNCGGFNVRYYTNDNNLPTNTFIKYNSMTNLYIPVREGYTFGGWYYDEALLQSVTTDKAIYLSNNFIINNDSVCPYINLYAKWLKRYDLNNASVSIPESMTNVVNIEVKKYEDPNQITTLRSFNELNKVNYSVYEIDLYDEGQNKVQPDGMVRIEFDIPANLRNTKLIVYRLEGSELIPYTVTVINNKATIDTNHFSTYILAEKQEASSTGVNKLFVFIGMVAFLVAVRLLLMKIRNKMA